MDGFTYNYNRAQDRKRNGKRTFTNLFIATAARVTVCLLESAQYVNTIIPGIVRIFTTGIIYTLSSTHCSRDYNSLNLIKTCKISYQVWLASCASDIINMIADPVCRYLKMTIRELEIDY